MKGNVLITGGTGMIGSRLTELLHNEGYEVSYLSRSKEDGKIKKYQWDIHKKTLEDDAIKNADYIINLVGANVFEKKWSKEFKKEILESRTESANLLFQKLKTVPNKVKAFVTASAIGYYGADTGEQLIDESTKIGKGFLPEVVEKWEAAVAQIESLNIRTVYFRIGIVLSPHGGAIDKMLGPIKMNAGAAIGTGKQYISWIHVDDLCNMFIKSLNDESMKGKYNAVAPNPVTNEELTKLIAHAVDKTIILPNIPAFALKVMLGAEKAEILIGGNNVSCEKIKKTGFQFKFSDINNAVDNLLKS